MPTRRIPDRFLNLTATVPPASSPSSTSIHVARRAQVDTAAQATVTPYRYLLHDYREYDDNFRCPIRLVAALDSNAKVQPLGEGYLHVPCHDATTGDPNFIAVRCYYSPSVTSTLLNENDLYGPSKSSINNFSGMCIDKFNDTGNFTVRCRHRVTSSLDIVIHGVLADNYKSLFTHPLIVPNLSADHPLASIYTSSAYALQHDTEFASEFDKAVNAIANLWKSDTLRDALDHRSFLQKTHPNQDTSFLDSLPYTK